MVVDDYDNDDDHHDGDYDDQDKGETVNPNKDWEKALPSLRAVDVQA